MIRASKAHPGAGFALLDMLLAVTLIAFVIVLVAPHLRDPSYLRVIAAGQVLRSDLELAQLMSIANPDDPVVARFGPDPGHPGAASYWLARASTPDTPISRSGLARPYRVTFGFDRARGATSVTIETSADVGDTLSFNEYGGLTGVGATPSVTLRHGTRWLRLEISPVTGSVTEVPDGA